MSSPLNDHDLAFRIANAIVERLAERGSLRGLSLHLFLDEESTNVGAAAAPVIDLGVIPLADYVSATTGFDTSATTSAPFSNHIQEQLTPESLISPDPTTSPNPSQPELQQPQRRSTRPRTQLSRSTSDVDVEPPAKQRRVKTTGGLRLGGPTNDEGDENDVRRLQSDVGRVPQRKPETAIGQPKLLPASLDNFVISIWQQIYSSMSFDISAVASQWRISNSAPNLISNEAVSLGGAAPVTSLQICSSAFSRMNKMCQRFTQASRSARAIEVIVQARWIEVFNDEVDAVMQRHSDISATKARMFVLGEAARDMNCTTKELRNKMAIWKGYKELKDAGGWVVLIFAGMGLYRFCKYRLGFTAESFRCLQRLQTRFEVAADTIHCRWREVLSIIGAASPPRYVGHPHDFVILESGAAAIPLEQTYLQWQEDFAYTQLDASIVDVDAWGYVDPRRVTTDETDIYACSVCGELQSDIISENQCSCFPNLYGGSNYFHPVQVMRTKNGKNNGLFACLPFERGTAIGEFIGCITRGLQDVDVMEGETPLHGRYQIYQGREGNYSRFINHSCRPNSQFERYIWRGLQRILLVSKGIAAGDEITADYGHNWWRNLDKVCLCGEACCRYKERRIVSSR